MGPRHLVLLGLLALPACSETGALEVTDGSAADGSDGSAAETGCDAKERLHCTEAFLTQGATIFCGDADYPGVCENGVARCPDGMVEIDRCTCYGPGLPACKCPALGQQCPTSPGF